VTYGLRVSDGMSQHELDPLIDQIKRLKVTR
jgi:hypothetical protein